MQKGSRSLHFWVVVLALPTLAAQQVQQPPAQGAGGPKLPGQGQGVLALTNTKSGISLSFSGTDWAVERTYHDASIGDQIVYLKSDVYCSLEHNARNVITIQTKWIPRVIGVNGPDQVPDSGDEGDIYYKIDRDLQATDYSTKFGSLPPYCVEYSAPFQFETLTYDNVLPVLGQTGDNGGPWGSTPLSTTDRFAYGQLDSFGNEWHTLTYWDDDEPMLAAAGVASGRLGASDGHCVSICVNPTTPVIQLVAPVGEEFYTTPLKAYHVPKIREQTSYLTDGVGINFVNLSTDEAVQYRVGRGLWATYDGNPLVASDLFPNADVPYVLSARCGAQGVVLTRAVIRNPAYPGASEQHGNLLWADEPERQAVANKVHNLQPFAESYSSYFRNDYFQGIDDVLTDMRGIWRREAHQAQASLNNALTVALEGPATAPTEAALCKLRLLRMARLQPVGNELSIDTTTPAKDFLSELGQTLQQFADAGVAYDILAAHYRRSQHPDGMSEIEELRIRDGLAKIAKNLLQVRSNYAAESGSGPSHYALGYEHALGAIALAMPTYATYAYGVSGGDMQTVNDLIDDTGEYWNPFPNQGVTWYEAVTDPEIATPGHPNVRFPFRSEFMYTDDGYWSGANDLQGDGSRYFSGPLGFLLVDVKYGGLANAECRVELIEMDGYELPFVSRMHAFDFMRRIKGDAHRPLCVTNYIRRRLVGGHVGTTWDSGTLTYSAGPPRVFYSLWAFNDHYEFAPLPSSMAMVGEFLTNLNIYYGHQAGTLPPSVQQEMEEHRKRLYDPYTLALLWDPTQLAPHLTEPNHRPVVKPLLKHVVHPGDLISKEIVAVDPDDEPLTVTVQNLPAGAVYDQPSRTITWTPGSGDAGVHVVTVTADDGQATTSRDFPMIVKTDAPAGPVPDGPTNVSAVLGGPTSVQLDWQAPNAVTVARYLIYRDGILWASTPDNVTTYTDTELIAPGQNIRYHVALLSSIGAESPAAATSPAIVGVPVN